MSGDNGVQTQESAIPAEAVEVPAQSQAVVAVAAPPTVAVAPEASPKDLVARLTAIEEVQKTAMKAGVDYGVIPGTEKPTLYKPGAEKLAALFQLDVQPQNEKRWEEDSHLTVASRVTIFHAPSGARLGAGEGVCSTRERKYAYRKAERKCPNCGASEVIKGRKEFGGGWLCWNKPERGRNGCGSKWPDGAEEIEKQAVGDIDNPDLPDLWNTVLKMAKKRGFVDAVLAVTGASAVFTQDVEDMALDQGPPQREQQAPPETTAHERKPSERPITGDQKGKVNQRLGAANLTDAEASAVRVWYCAKNGASHFDRLPTKQASNLINELREDGSGARVLLDDLRVEASNGDEVAVKIVSRMEGAESA